LLNLLLFLNLTLLNYVVNCYNGFMNEDRIARDLQRLEEMQRRTQERLDKQQARVNERFEHARQRLEQRVGKSSLNQERIVEAALELLKEQGLGNLSLRDIAKRLDIKAPALYWHFKNKEELVDFMAEAILEKEFSAFVPLADGENWQDWLTTMMSRLRKAMLAYPDGGRVVAGAHLYPAITLAKLSNTTIASLQSAGLPLEIAFQVALTTAHYTFGHVIEEQAAPTPEQMQQFDIDAFLEPYPELAKAIKSSRIRIADPDAVYIAGLRLIIDGATTSLLR
jgi:TetR/AcrR family tetracycline transcriptional repressor